MTNPYAFTRTFTPGPWMATLTPLQRAIHQRVQGTINYDTFGGPEIRAPFHSLTGAIESAFVLTPREALPKIANTPATPTKRSFYFAGDPFVPYSTDPNHTSERARQTAAKWLAIAGHLEAEENIAAAEAKKKAEAEKAAEYARTKRLSALAGEYFDSYFTDLGPKKARVIEEIYRLEQELTEEKDAA